MAIKPHLISFFSDTLWKSSSGHYFRMWFIVTSKEDCWQLVNEDTGAEARYTEEKLKQMVINGKLERVWA